MNIWKTILMVLVASAALLACGDDDTKKSPEDNNVNNVNNLNNTTGNNQNNTGNNTTGGDNTTGNNTTGNNTTENNVNNTNGETNNGTANNTTNNGTNSGTNNTNNGTNNTTNNQTNNNTNTADGACNNDDDIAELGSNIGTIEEASADCGFQCAADGDVRTCAGMCIENTEGVNLSSGCADCFGAVVECIVDSCLVECIAGQDSPSCVECREMNCDPIFEMCAGIQIP